MKSLVLLVLCIATILNCCALDATTQEANVAGEWAPNSGTKIKRDALYTLYTNALAQVVSESQKKNEIAYEQYAKKLDALLNAVRLKGDFDGYNAIKQEADRLRAERKLALGEKPSMPELTLAMSECQKQLSSVDIQRKGQTGEVTKKYMIVLRELVKDLVIQEKIEEARILNNEIELLSETLPSPMMDSNTGKGESNPPRKPIETSLWQDITATFSGGKRLGSAFVLYKNQMTSKASYRTPVEIKYNCKTDSNDLRISYAGRTVIFNYEGGRRRRLRADGETEREHFYFPNGSIPANQFVTIRQVVLPDKMEVYVNDDLRGSWVADFSEKNERIEIISPNVDSVPTITVKSVHLRVPALKRSAEKPSIPSDAKAYKGCHYLVVDTQTTWAKAKIDAEYKGGHLVTIKDKQEMDFVTATLLSATKSPVGSEKWAWVGASYEKQRWLWLDGTSVDSYLWASKYKKPRNVYDDPVAMLDTQSGLREIPRSASLVYVIEWDE